MTTNEKKLWRERWLSSINELTSLELQKKSWLDNTHTNPHWSFVEFMCSYFDGLFIDNNYKYPLDKGWLTKQEYEIIKDWHAELDKYNSPNEDDYDHRAILNDTKWLDILLTGMSAKNNLADLLIGDEKVLLIEEINYLKHV